jgi:hypothetical protein
MKQITVVSVAFLALVIAGCGVTGGESPITPFPDGPTFLYFYTDG